MAFYDVGKRIKEYRIKAGLNQEQLAEMALLNRVTIAKYETGIVEPGIQAVARIADVLGVTTDALLGRGDPHEMPAEKAPRTPEARIVSTGMDRMPQDKRETLLSVILTMYQKDHPEYFKQEEGAEDETGL